MFIHVALFFYAQVRDLSGMGSWHTISLNDKLPGYYPG